MKHTNDRENLFALVHIGAVAKRIAINIQNANSADLSGKDRLRLLELHPSVRGEARRVLIRRNVKVQAAYMRFCASIDGQIKNTINISKGEAKGGVAWQTYGDSFAYRF